MNFDPTNPKASLLERDDVRAFVRLVAHYSETCSRFEAERFGEIIPHEILQELREINHTSIIAAMTSLMNRCLEIVADWHETIPASELAKLRDNLESMRMKDISLAHFSFFGISDFAMPPQPQEQEK